MFACTAPQRSHSIHTPRCASRPRARADLTVARAVEHKPSVVVIGAGVLGLTCALTLAERDKYDITVIAEKFSPDTTSDVAAAFWYPFLVRPKERADAWALQSYSWFVELRAREGGERCGVEMRRCRELLKTADATVPGWASGIEYFAELSKDDVPASYVGGFEFDVPVVEMPKFLPWLVDACKSRGVTFERRKLDRVEDARAPLVINCAGLGARDMFDDDEIVPIRGQVVYIKQDCDVGMFDDSSATDLAYLIPRSDVTVLGGTAQVGSFDIQPSAEDEEDIIRKCQRLWPELDRSLIVGTRVGLRPSRSTVRLELDDKVYGDTRVVHCVGHGGAGVTLARGSALEVADIVDRILARAA